MRHGIVMVALAAAASWSQGCRDNPTDGDGDVDTDVDGDVDGDGDADEDGFIPACYPALGVCDPVARCGCADGQYCDVEFAYDGVAGETLEVCIGNTGGTGVHGDVGCSPGTCAPGFFCAGEADPEGNPVSVCRRWCVEEEDCSEYPGSLCNRELCYVDGDGNPIGCVEPYKLCTPEDVALGAGTARFTVCTGLPAACPGNLPRDYEISGGDVNGRCDVDLSTSPASLTFNLRDVDQSLSITGNRLLFEPREGFSPAEAGDRTLFTIYLPDGSIYPARELSSPARNGTCEIRIRYRPAEEGFDLEFTCDHIGTAFDDNQLVTLVDGALGPGTLAMDGCLVAAP